MAIASSNLSSILATASVFTLFLPRYAIQTIPLFVSREISAVRSDDREVEHTRDNSWKSAYLLLTSLHVKKEGYGPKLTAGIEAVEKCQDVV